MATDKKRIAKNSIYLYIRTFLTIIVALYTSRVILTNLGAVDFGILSVVGGLAVVFSFFNNALSMSTMRFITVSIGKDSVQQTQRIFSMSMNCHLIIAIVIFILAETIGLWFLNNKLDIPPDKMLPANWVYQFSLLSCLIGIVGVPYNGCIIANERMSFFAVMSIISVLLKLIIAWLIVICDSDNRLIFYSFLLFSTSIISFIINWFYCKFKFEICKYIKSWNRRVFNEMMSFTGWNLFKTGALMGMDQGNNILVNMFGGPIASAAMGISNQVFSTTYGFIQNVQTAFNPQITKSISINDTADSVSLIYTCAKFTSYLYFFFAIPVLINIDEILSLWLGNVPTNTSIMCSFCIMTVFLATITGPLNIAAMAKGNIKRYQIATSIIWAMVLPIGWISLVLGMPFKYILFSKLLMQSVLIVYSINYLCSFIAIPKKDFYRLQVLRPLLMLCFVYITIYIVKIYLPTNEFIKMLFTTILSWLLLSMIIWFWGLNQREKELSIGLIRKYRNKFH